MKQISAIIDTKKRKIIEEISREKELAINHTNDTNNVNPRPEFLEIGKFKNEIILVDLDIFEENFYETIIKNISEIRMQNDQVQIIVLTSKSTEESELLREAFSTFAQMTIFDIADKVEDYKYTILDMLENSKTFSYANKYNVNLQKIIKREVEIKEVVKEKEVIKEKYRNTKKIAFVNIHNAAGASFLASNFAAMITKSNQTAALIEPTSNFYFREKFLKNDDELEKLTQKEIEDYHLNFSKKYNIFQKIKKGEAVDYSEIKKINGVKLYTSEESKNTNFERQDYINLLHSTKSQYNIIDFSNSFEEFEKIIDQMDHIFFVFSDFSKSKNIIEELVKYQENGHDIMFLKNKHHSFEEEKTELLRRKFEINYMIRFPAITEKELKKEMFQARKNMNFEINQNFEIFKIFKNELFAKVRECFELEKLDIKSIRRDFAIKKRRNTGKKRVNQILDIIGLTAKIGAIIGIIYVAISVATSFSGNSWGL